MGSVFFYGSLTNNDHDDDCNNEKLFSLNQFVGQGLTVIARNYLGGYIYEKWSDKEILDYESIPEFQPTSIDLVGGQTQPPNLLTEADLIALMDKHGIGTDATHAEHIEKVKTRSYIGVQVTTIIIQVTTIIR